MLIQILNLIIDKAANLVNHSKIIQIKIFCKFIKKNLKHHKLKNNNKGKNFLKMTITSNFTIISEVGLCQWSIGELGKNNYR